jgi:hypothetical protein
MRADAIHRRLRHMGVPLERAQWAATKYGDDGTIPQPDDKARKMIEREARRQKADFERRKFRLWCTANALPLPVAELHFASHLPKKCNYRFDFAWPNPGGGGIALEVNGGIWRKGGGAHTGTGHIRDMNKLNLAQSLGWRVVQRTPEKLCTSDTLDLLRPLLAWLTPLTGEQEL